jgi:hypothetical protein
MSSHGNGTSPNITQVKYGLGSDRSTDNRPAQLTIAPLN